MKRKRNNLKLISQEQMRKEPWTAFAQIQQQAKTGTVTALEPSLPIAAVQAIAAADPLRATVGSVIAQALKATDTALVAIGEFPIALDAREVLFVPAGGSAGQDVADALDAVTNCVKSAQLTFDGGADNNAPMTNAVANGTGISTQVNAALAAAKPSFSLTSIINKLEDLVTADPTIVGVVVVDQESEKIFLYTAPIANSAALMGVAAEESAGGFDTVAGFEVDASPASTAENQFGE